MKFRNTSRWKNKDEMRGLLYFVQRVDEMTFPYSLDSYKSPTTSLQGLVHEALNLIRLAKAAHAQDVGKALGSLSHVIDELKVRLSGNWIAKSVVTLDVNGLTSLDKDSADPAEVERRLNILSADLHAETYISEIVDQVIRHSEDGRHKRKLDLLAKEFVSTLQYRNVSREHINSSLLIFFFSGDEITNSAQLKDYCQIVYPHNHRFLVFVGVSDAIVEIDEEVLRSQGINHLIGPNSPPLAEGEEEDEEDEEEEEEDEEEEEEEEDDEEEEEEDERLRHIAELEFDLEKYRDETGAKAIAALEVEATDYNSAVTRACAKVDGLSNLYRLFNHKRDIAPLKVALAEQACCGGVRKWVEIPQNNMHFIRDMRSVKASSTLKRFNENISLDVGPDSVKFKNIVNIHGMSLSSSSADIQLVNLWTCLETISPGGTHGSKIGNVLGRVIPCLMLGYYNRLVANLLFDIIRWDRVSLSQSLKIGSFDQKFDLKQKFTLLLSDKENDAALADLLARCRDFELLRFRIFSIAEVMRDSAAAKKKLDLHEQTLKWQLHRIYRTRNSIVHAGESPVYTKYLVENAHDFFDQTLMFCLELSSWKTGFNTFLTCFDYAAAKYKEYYGELAHGNGTHLVWTLPKMKDRRFIFPDTETE